MSHTEDSDDTAAFSSGTSRMSASRRSPAVRITRSQSRTPSAFAGGGRRRASNTSTFAMRSTRPPAKRTAAGTLAPASATSKRVRIDQSSGSGETESVGRNGSEIPPSATTSHAPTSIPMRSHPWGYRPPEVSTIDVSSLTTESARALLKNVQCKLTVSGHSGGACLSYMLGVDRSEADPEGDHCRRLCWWLRGTGAKLRLAVKSTCNGYVSRRAVDSDHADNS